MIFHGFVQAGGGSTRFGTDKALVKLAGKSMLERTGELLGSVCQDVNIVAPSGKYREAPWPVLADGWPGEGPLGGILTALNYLKETTPTNESGTRKHGPGSFALILSCDLPFLTKEFLSFLKDRALSSEAQVVVPESSSGLEPLCACWRSEAAATLQAGFDAGGRKVSEAMKRLRMEVLDHSSWKRFDNENRLFWNMNTPEDFREARRILEAKAR
jgi:molybdopterin-guanine dinucleotide biosynthesis protein A